MKLFIALLYLKFLFFPWQYSLLCAMDYRPGAKPYFESYIGIHETFTKITLSALLR